jgi:RNA polymerase sigma-70 factor (subfamily 1)
MSTDGTPFDSAAEWRALQAGDEQALQRLMSEHLPGLRAYVRLRMGPTLRAKESCSDIVQSACREVLAHMDRFQHPGEGAFRAWLYTTAQRKIANRAEFLAAARRDVAREQAADTAVLGAYASFCTPSDHAMGNEALQRIEHAFDGLSESHRDVIVLTRVLGLTRQDVAEKMGRSEASVRSLLTRALAELADGLVDP